MLVFDPEGNEVTSSIPGLVYSSSIGGLYSYMEYKPILNVQLPPGYTCRKITARWWSVSTNTDTPITFQQITLRRILPISIE